MSNTAENIAVVGGKAATYGGAAGAVVSGLSISEWGVVGGLLIAVLGWVCTQYWSWRRDQREERESAARLEMKFGAHWEDRCDG
ncbi:holin [Comamonas terrae]|uniref:Holin n=1 Tax=Comamonas terrae TaxID=673548 RepID=A0ABW5UU30_9BURK|nr:holin [Comamonas terrae]